MRMSYVEPQLLVNASSCASIWFNDSNIFNKYAYNGVRCSGGHVNFEVTLF